VASDDSSSKRTRAYRVCDGRVGALVAPMDDSSVTFIHVGLHTLNPTLAPRDESPYNDTPASHHDETPPQ
jgi:hypothetical protein